MVMKIQIHSLPYPPNFPVNLNNDHSTKRKREEEKEEFNLNNYNKKKREEEKEEEPILKENLERFVLFPIKFEEIWKFYKNQFVLFGPLKK